MRSVMFFPSGILPRRKPRRSGASGRASHGARPVFRAAAARRDETLQRTVVVRGAQPTLHQLEIGPSRASPGPPPSMFVLAPAEARLACRLAAGDKLEEAAGAPGMTRNTARVQLRAVLGKAGIGRQGELLGPPRPLSAVRKNSILIVRLGDADSLTALTLVRRCERSGRGMRGLGPTPLGDGRNASL